jgi:hypothetical protein
MIRATPWWLLGLLVLSWTAGAQQPAPAPAPVHPELRLEQRLLSLDLLSYSESRERQRRAQQAVSDVLDRLDQALAGDSVALGTLEALQTDLDAARAAARIIEERLSSQLDRIQERLRRIALLEGDASARPLLGSDPLTGRWRVTILPQNIAATFDLRLNGTVVTGTYQVAGGGSAGSFRGTYTGGVLKLERIDARGGFDSVWEAAVGSGRLAGTWMANELVTGQPTRGDWIAVLEGERQP